MTVRVTGPVNRDFVEGDLTNWHLEAFNPTDSVVTITMTLFNLETTPASVLGTTIFSLLPRQWRFENLLTLGVEHTMVQLEYAVGRNDILTTLYGRTATFENLAGATYRHEELTDLA